MFLLNFLSSPLIFVLVFIFSLLSSHANADSPTQPEEVISLEQFQASVMALYSDFVIDPTYYFSCDSSLYSELDSRLNDITTRYFYEDGLISEFKSALADYYTVIGTDKLSALQPGYTSEYEYYSSLYSAVTVWSPVPTTPSTTSSWDTKVTGTEGYLSDYYILAKCNALINDVNNYGYLYNEFFDENISTNLNQIETFYDQYNSYFNFSLQKDANEYCNTLVTLIDILPWEDRLLDIAKRNYYTDYLPFTGQIYMGTKLLLPEPPSYNTIPVTATDTDSSLAITSYHPMVIKYNLTVSLADTNAVIQTNTTTYATKTSVGQGTVVTNTVSKETPTITSDIGKLISAGAEAFIYDYNSNVESYESYLSANLNETFVSNYAKLIHDHKDTDILLNSTAFQEVLQGFYNFIFQLPPAFKDRLQDRIGFAFMRSQTDSNSYHMTQFTDGSGDFFRQVFKFGFNDSFLEWTTDNNGNSQEVTQEVTEYFPVFPTMVDKSVLIELPELDNNGQVNGAGKAGLEGLFGLG